MIQAKLFTPLNKREKPLQTSIESWHGYTILRLSGNIDHLKDSISLKSNLISLIDDKHHRIALHLKELNYIDSAAINVLLYVKETLQKTGGNFFLVEPNQYVLDVLGVLGLTSLFSIVAKQEELPK
ncbi:MAG: hypothetical protein A2293_12035 [Elusimicrobia bacterium RIFOXYB2_FULL_49_7]|nr:MAG: hypothetical protein A2293_12035 [Elusimicrobia bacterium RIFOXYB2_FULL_49_7]